MDRSQYIYGPATDHKYVVASSEISSEICQFTSTNDCEVETPIYFASRTTGEQLNEPRVPKLYDIPNTSLEGHTEQNGKQEELFDNRRNVVKLKGPGVKYKEPVKPYGVQKDPSSNKKSVSLF